MNNFKFAFLVVSAGFVLALSGCNQPDNRAEVAHAYHIAGMWQAALNDSLNCQDHPIPYARPIHVGEDIASEQQEAWTAYANNIK